MSSKTKHTLTGIFSNIIHCREGGNNTVRVWRSHWSGDQFDVIPKKDWKQFLYMHEFIRAEDYKIFETFCDEDWALYFKITGSLGLCPAGIKEDYNDEE